MSRVYMMGEEIVEAVHEEEGVVYARNILANGNFKYGKDGWLTSGYQANFKVINGVAETTSVSKQPGFIYRSSKIKTGHKFYYNLKTKVSNVVELRDFEIIKSVLRNDGYNAFELEDGWNTISAVDTWNPNTYHNYIRLFYAFENESNKAFLEYLYMVDLTKVFGADNEPTKKIMDDLFDKTGYVPAPEDLINSLKPKTYPLSII